MLREGPVLGDEPKLHANGGSPVVFSPEQA